MMYPTTDTHDIFNQLVEEYMACANVLAGKTVNGVRLGDAGITREWCENHKMQIDKILRNDPGNYIEYDDCDRSYLVYTGPDA